MTIRNEKKKIVFSDYGKYLLVGVGLILAGVIALLGKYLELIDLVFILLPGVGLVLFIAGIYSGKQGYYIPGALVIMTGIGLVFFFQDIPRINLQQKIGVLVGCFSISWFIILFLNFLIKKKISYWTLLPGFIGSFTALTFLFTSLRLLDFVLFLSIGCGIALLLWGIFSRLLGLIIPGALLFGVGPGLFFPWTSETPANGLAQTGIMLVWFAFGWALIVIANRLVFHKFIWWPLIPGGVLAMVGWGLYLGGNPRSALNFLGNSGSILIILIGVYLLMIRRGLHR